MPGFASGIGWTGSFCIRLLLTALLWTSLCNAENLAPDELAIFDGATSLDFAGRPELDLSAPAIVEFWVSPGWLEEPEYPPCVISSLSPDGVNFAVHIGADRKSVGLYAGNRYASLPVDLTDEAMHHVSLISLGNVTEIEVDGEPYGVLEVGMLSDGSASFHIGSLDGTQAPFVGALARVRLWRSLQEDDVDPDALVAQSLFSAGGLDFVVYPETVSGVQTGGIVDEASTDGDGI